MKIDIYKCKICDKLFTTKLDNDICQECNLKEDLSEAEQ